MEDIFSAMLEKVGFDGRLMQLRRGNDVMDDGKSEGDLLPRVMSMTLTGASASTDGNRRQPNEIVEDSTDDSDADGSSSASIVCGTWSDAGASEAALGAEKTAAVGGEDLCGCGGHGGSFMG
jgi:hypothetical protein